MKLEIISLLIGSIVGGQIFKKPKKKSGKASKIPVKSKIFEDEELLSKDFEDL